MSIRHALRRSVQDMIGSEWTPEADVEFGARIIAIELQTRAALRIELAEKVEAAPWRGKRGGPIISRAHVLDLLRGD